MGARHIQRLVAASSFALISALCSISAFNELNKSEPGDSRQPVVPWSAANTCMGCHQQSGDHSAALYAHSVHARAGFTCDSCHGGDQDATDKAAAHGSNFSGKPSAIEQLARCGACHGQPVADLKTSSHFPKNLNVPRLACSDCHGAHTVGSPRRDFSFAMFCANCHGLEYLPELPAEFRKLLQAADEENGLLARFNVWGRKPSNELLAKRKAIRHIIGELIHKTDLRHGVERAPEITRLNETFKKMSGAQTK